MARFIQGVGMTSFGTHEETSQELCHGAICEALDHTHASLEKIDAVVVARNDFMTDGEHQRLFPGVLGSLLKKDIPILQVTAACASGGVALWNASLLPFENVLVVGVEKFSSAPTLHVTGELLTAAESAYEQAEGVIFPAQYALVAQQYMGRHGATADDLALVALKNHENAFSNEKARFFGKRVTLDMIKTSPVVASPLRMYDCSISVDGAAAVIVSKEKSDIAIVGSGLCTSSIASFEADDMTCVQSTILAAKDAYQQAHIHANEVHCAEIHDAFTSAELMAYEGLGFAGKGEAKKLIRNGTTKMNGSLPINMSGGLKAKGHPVSATGLAQVYELAKQLRGEAGKRQLDDPRIGLTHNMGGCGATSVVHILRKQ